jgi:hypothetical protein
MAVKVVVVVVVWGGVEGACAIAARLKAGLGSGETIS